MPAAASRRRPVVLCILDGWGHREAREDNAIAQAATPVWDRWQATRPHSLLDASAAAVGLPVGQMGNSEVGHMSIGAGRVVVQELPRINAAVADGGLAAAPALGRFITRLGDSGGVCHLLGLLSPGGVHSHQDHMVALAAALAAAGVRVRVHAFLDGRDTPPRSAGQALAAFQAAIAPLDRVSVATLCGRYTAMDRDRRWSRTEAAYAALVDGRGRHAAGVAAAIAASYGESVSDEFVVPTVIGDYAGMANGDGLLMANFRADRARQILAALLDGGFDGFARPHRIAFAAALGMVRYSDALAPLIEAIFVLPQLSGTLGEVVAAAGLRQLRAAETEKYAHVTFFFDGGQETEHAGVRCVLVPSPKVATYDLKPEMAAAEVTDVVVAALEAGDSDLVVVNYANADMVGHTGDMAAAMCAVATLDHCLGRVEAAVAAAGGALLVTADHGNIEQMRDSATAEAHTTHTLNKVPLVLACGDDAVALADGSLADVAPTVLAILGLEKPAEMTGRSLLGVAEAGRRATG